MAIATGLGLLFRAAGMGLNFATRLPGAAAIGVGTHYATGGASTSAMLDAGGRVLRSGFSGATGINRENINNLMEDFSEGDWASILQNPMLMGAAGLATFALSAGIMGNGLISSVITGLLVAGAAYVAQQHLLPGLFSEQAADPNAPAPRLTTAAPAAQPAPAPEGPEMP